MTRDIKLELLGKQMSEPIGPWGTQYGNDDKWYIFPIRNGDALARGTTIWSTETLARKYVSEFNKDEEETDPPPDFMQRMREGRL